MPLPRTQVKKVKKLRNYGSSSAAYQSKYDYISEYTPDEIDELSEYTPEEIDEFSECTPEEIDEFFASIWNWMVEHAYAINRLIKSEWIIRGMIKIN